MFSFIIQVSYDNNKIIIIKKNSCCFFLQDEYVALERSTTKPIQIDINKFLKEYPDYLSIYESWKRLDNYMKVFNTKFFFDRILYSFLSKGERHYGYKSTGGIR